MPAGDSQQFEQLAWEGVVSGPTALALFVVIVLLAAWSLWRECDAVGRRWALLFFVLRVAGFGCALWMLAGPTQLRINRTTVHQSIAIFADGSESMETVDPPDPAESLRWRLAIAGAGDKSVVARCDRLNVALGDALAGSRRLAGMVKEHRPPQQLAAATRTVQAAVTRASTHAVTLADSLDGPDESLAERASRIGSMMEGPVTESLAAVEDAIASSDQILAEDFGLRLEQLVGSLTSARRRAGVLVADLAQVEAAGADKGGPNVDALTRREKEGQTLDALEGEIGKTLGEKVRVDRFRFDRTAVPIGIGGGGWVSALANPDERSTAIRSAPWNDGAPPQTDVASGGPSTNLTSVLEQLANQRSGESTRLALILSDGRHNDVDAPAPQEIAAHLANVPLYVVPIGNSSPMRDVLLHRVEAPSAVAEKDSAVIDVIITGFDCDGQATNVVLRHEGREVERKPIEFTGGRGDQRVRFMVPAKELGRQEYVVEVEPIDEETNTANNFQPVSFEVVRDRLRILLADGISRWEYRYLNQLFRRDQHVQFDELLFFPRLHGSGELAARPEFPRDVEGWSKYEVVILGDLTPQQLSAESQQSLVESVRTRGGNVIVIAGRNGMPAAFEGQPLMELLPVEPAKNVFPQQGYALRLTDEGRFHSALLIADSPQDSREAWKRVYERFPVYELSEYCHPKPTTRTLIEAVNELADDVKAEKDDSAEAVDRAFLCWQRVGAGRVAYLAAPDTWRLRWRRGDRMHHRFWGQFLRWITAAESGAGSELVRLQTDRTRYAAGEPVEVTVWLKDTAGRPLAGEMVQAEAKAFNDETRTVALTPDPDVAGRYYGTLDDVAAGAYQIGVRGKVIDELLPPGGDAKPVQATITVRAADSVEMLNTQCNHALLEQIAQLTGGQVVPPTAISEVLELVSFTPEVSEHVERTPLWNRWSNLFLVLGCLFTEWVVRKAKGFV